LPLFGVTTSDSVLYGIVGSHEGRLAYKNVLYLPLNSPNVFFSELDHFAFNPRKEAD